jgi:hypothetical protein
MILTKASLKLAISTNARDALRTHTFVIRWQPEIWFRAISRWFRPTIQEGYTPSGVAQPTWTEGSDRSSRHREALQNRRPTYRSVPACKIHTYENTYDANYGWGICLKLGPNAKILSSIIAVAVWDSTASTRAMTPLEAPVASKNILLVFTLWTGGNAIVHSFR